MTPTLEQLAIVEAARASTSNLLVVARAGAAKTTTLCLIAEALRDTETLSLAFNKKISEEMKLRLPDNCRSMTLNGLGHKAWQQFLRRRIKLETGKCYGLLKDRIEALDGDDRKEAYSRMSETLQAIRLSKHTGYVPESYRGYWKPLLSDEEFFFSASPLDFEPDSLQQELITQVAKESFSLALNGTIDFDDQILGPALCPVEFDHFPLILVDEAQDLSTINHRILKKLVRNNRVIAVGDPCQALYAFRGADENSMEKLQRLFNMEEFRLTTSFRCASSVIAEAMWRAPDMIAWSGAPAGEVRTLSSWTPATIPDEAAVICRNNAPLFHVAIQLLKAGRYPELLGRDVVKGLVKIMRKLGKPDQHVELTRAALAQWEEKEAARSRNPHRIEDQAACISIFLDQATTLGDAIAYAEHIASRSGHIKLMTGHKAKGLEFDEVFFLDQHLIGRGGQEPNIKYVIQTRAKQRLTYIRSEDLETAEIAA